MKAKIKISNFFLSLLAVLLICSCSDQTSDPVIRSDTSDETSNDTSTDNSKDKSDTSILDLRIKNGTDLYAAKSISYEGNIAGDAVVTPHVAAKAVSSGIQFDITCPTDPCYSQGFGTVLIYRIENDENTTGATLDSWYKSGTLSFVYPLCEAGEAYRFKVQIEPTDLNNNRDFQYYEYIDITAKGGIGDINYSNINARKWVTAGYANNAPTVKIENCIPPDAKDVKTYVAFFAGNGDWETNNATVWFDYYSAPGIEFTINPDADWINGFTYAINSTGKDRFFAQYEFSFEIPDCDLVTLWTTKAIQSEIVKVE